MFGFLNRMRLCELGVLTGHLREPAVVTAEDHQRLWDIKQQYDWLPWPEYLAWCSYLTKDEPPSREITPPDAEPFVL